VEVIYEDNHLLVVNKPAGILTQPSGTDQISLEQMAKNWLKEKYSKPGNVFLEAVHRLDKPVSGIVVFGKTSKALSRLNAFIRLKDTKKIYIAGVEGIPKEKKGLLENYLIHDEFCAQIVSSTHPQGKLARLSFQIMETKENSSLLEIELETGRYHQIRVQLAGIGCPIWGDKRYGSHRNFNVDTIALHHASLWLPHPITHEILILTAPLPIAFKTIYQK
jgi:23S rRNA pseudouridine1911/1915/1917 synthase